MTRVSFHAATAAIIIALFAAPAVAQVEVVAKYRAPYQAPLSADQKVALLRAVASEVHGGLLRKPDGTNCGGYSCDIVCFSDVTLFDVLQDQDNLAIPRWDPTTNPRGYRCELVASVGPPPPPICAPPETIDISAILRRIAELSARIGAPPNDALYQQNERIYADLTNQHHDQTATLKAAIDSPAWYNHLWNFVSDPRVAPILAGAFTYVFTKKAMQP